jgi:hypothetical protein
MALAVRRSRLPRCASALSQADRVSLNPSSLVGRTRFGYFGSVIAGRRSQSRTVLRANPVLLAISCIDRPSRMCIRLIFASIPT